MALGLTHPPTEMSTRNISWGVKVTGYGSDNLSTFLCQLSWNLGALTSWSPQGLSRPIMGLLNLVQWIFVQVITDTCLNAALPVVKTWLNFLRTSPQLMTWNFLTSWQTAVCVCVCVRMCIWFNVSLRWSHLGSGLFVCVIQNSKKSDILLVEHHNIKSMQYVLDEKQWNKLHL